MLADPGLRRSGRTGDIGGQLPSGGRHMPTKIPCRQARKVTALKVLYRVCISLVPLTGRLQPYPNRSARQLVAFLALQGATVVDAADITQNTMIAAYNRWHTIDHPRPWVFRVAGRALIRRKLDQHETPVGVLTGGAQLRDLAVPPAELGRSGMPGNAVRCSRPSSSEEDWQNLRTAPSASRAMWVGATMRDFIHVLAAMVLLGVGGGPASGLVNTTQQVGVAVGLAVLPTLAASRVTAELPTPQKSRRADFSRRSGSAPASSPPRFSLSRLCSNLGRLWNRRSILRLRNLGVTGRIW
jgi:hypothetical protein